MGISDFECEILYFFILELICCFYFQGNFHHWRPLFLHFDTYFKTYLASRNDLLLSDRILEDDSPFPKQAVLQILRVMQVILENCHNKSSLDGLEVCNFCVTNFVSPVFLLLVDSYPS